MSSDFSFESSHPSPIRKGSNLNPSQLMDVNTPPHEPGKPLGNTSGGGIGTGAGTGAGAGGNAGMDPRGRMMDSLGRTVGPFGVFETPLERRKRYWSIGIAAINLFIDAIMFPILIPTQLFYYRIVDGQPVEPPGGIPPANPMDDTFRYAWLFVTFSLGQFIFTPIFNWWYQKRGMKEVILCSKLIMIIGNLIYALSLNIWVLGVARFLIGIGSSTILTTRGYVTYATQKEERPMYLHLLASLRLMGLMGGPLLGFMFISTDFQLWEGGPSVDMYSAPAYFCAILGIVFIGVAVGVFKEFSDRGAEELMTKSERESSATGMTREYRVSEVTPLVSRERQVYFDRTALMAGNLLLFIVGAGYSVFAVLQPLLAYDQFGWGIRENYIFFGISALICLLCCLITPLILSYVDSRAVLVFSLVSMAAGFLGRIHFAGTDDAWRVQYLSVTVSLIVTGYTTTSVILFGLFTKQLGFGESVFVVNSALAFVNIAQALTPLWAIALYNVNSQGLYIWLVLAVGLGLSGIGVLLFWKRLIPKAAPTTSINSHLVEEDDDDDDVNTFTYRHRESHASSLNQAWRASLARHIPGTPESGYGYLSEGSNRKRKPKKRPKRRETSPEDSGDSDEDAEARRRSSRRVVSVKTTKSKQSEDQVSKQTTSGRTSPVNEDPLSGGNQGGAIAVTGGEASAMGGVHHHNHPHQHGEGGQGEVRRRSERETREDMEQDIGEGGLMLMDGEGVREARHRGREDEDEDDDEVGGEEAGRRRDRGGDDNEEEEERDRTRGDEEEEEEGEEDEDDDDDDDDDDDLFDDKETGIDDASELDDALEIQTPQGSMAKHGMQKLSRRYSKTKPDSFSRSF